MFRNFLKNYFEFSRSEQNGVIALLVIIVVILLLTILAQTLKNAEQPTVSYLQQINKIEQHVNSQVKLKSIPPKICNKVINNKPKIVAKIELNTANSAQLCSLPGIGSAFATRIIKYRNYLRGYYNITQLTEVYGLKDSVIQIINPYLMVDTTYIQPITLYPDSLKLLFHHPYISYQQAKTIANYVRKQKQSINCLNLFQNNIITYQQYVKIRPYIQ